LAPNSGCAVSLKSELFTLEAGRRDASRRIPLAALRLRGGDERILVNIDKRAKLADNDRCVGTPNRPV